MFNVKLEINQIYQVNKYTEFIRYKQWVEQCVRIIKNIIREVYK